MPLLISRDIKPKIGLTGRALANLIVYVRIKCSEINIPM